MTAPPYDGVQPMVRAQGFQLIWQRILVMVQSILVLRTVHTEIHHWRQRAPTYMKGCDLHQLRKETLCAISSFSPFRDTPSSRLLGIYPALDQLGWYKVSSQTPKRRELAVLAYHDSHNFYTKQSSIRCIPSHLCKNQKVNCINPGFNTNGNKKFTF